jgi:hypothetical protein
MTDANAHVGAVHDAVAYEGSMAKQALDRANELSLEGDDQGPNPPIEPNAGKAALGADDIKIEPEAPPAEASTAPPPATLFERREQEAAKQKDEDYTKALNQKGEQTATEAANAEKGTEGAAAPTLGDTLTDDQKSALKTLAERRAAEAPKPEAADEEKVMLEAYGVWVEKSMYGRKYMGVERTTLLIDADGKVAQVWNKVKVPGHAEAVLAEARALA